MPKPLQDFYSFSVFANREFYKSKTGVEAPPWNPDKPLKHWADENPTNTEFDEIIGEFAIYKPVAAMLPNGRNREGADGQPVTGSLRLSVEDAKAYNFLPSRGVVPVAGQFLNGVAITAAHVANAARTIQPPLNLPDGSRLGYSPGIQVVVVYAKGETIGAPAPGAGGFTDADRALIQRIAVKVGA